MPLVRFENWTPDAASLGNPGSINVKNVYPGLTSFKPVGQLSPNTGSTQERVLGAISGVNKSSVSFQYCGDASRLYLQSGNHWDDVSRAAGYTTGIGEVWEFAQWKDKILGVNFSDDPQEITMAVGNLFSDLVTTFTARHIAVVGNFVVVGNINDDIDGVVPWRVKWSAFNDEADWVISPVTQSSQRDLQTGDDIKRVIGGEFGVVLNANSTWRMTYVGPPVVFQFDEVLTGIGAISGGAAVQLAGIVFFLSEHGFIALSNGTTATFIGSGKVDQFVQKDLDTSNLNRISSAAEPKTGRVAWAYPGAGNLDGLPNRIIIFDRTLNKWSLIVENVTLLWRSLGVSTTLEELDAVSSSIDDLELSLDSDAWKASGFALSAFNVQDTAATQNHVLLVPFDGKDAQTTASDFSASAHPIFFVADAQLDTALEKFGQSSLFLDGLGDHLSIPTSPDWVFDGPFTIHAWVSPIAIAAPHTIVGNWDINLNARSWVLQLDPSEFLEARFSTHGLAATGTITDSVAISTAGDFTHVAVTRDGMGDIRLFKGGVEVGTSINIPGALFDSGQPIGIGSRHGNAVATRFAGHIDQVEIIKGVALWTSNFTPPGTPTAIPGGSRSGVFEGSTMTAEIETKELEISPGRKTHLNAFRPVVDGGAVTAKVSSRDRQTDPSVNTETLVQSASGRFTKRVNSRYHKFLFEISGDWNDAIGVDIEGAEARRGERRG